MLPHDTTAAAQAAQLEAYRRLGPAGRARLAAKMSEDARSLTRSGIHARHPSYSNEEVELALRRLLYGDELFRRAWPDRPLIAP
jgi:hypothetical protein